MTHYRVWCVYEPDHVNLPAGRKGQWRVDNCIEVDPETETYIARYPRERIIALPSTKHYPRGSIIRPHKELNNVLNSRKEDKCK